MGFSGITRIWKIFVHGLVDSHILLLKEEVLIFSPEPRGMSTLWGSISVYHCRFCFNNNLCVLWWILVSQSYPGNLKLKQFLSATLILRVISCSKSKASQLRVLFDCLRIRTMLLVKVLQRLHHLAIHTPVQFGFRKFKIYYL